MEYLNSRTWLLTWTTYGTWLPGDDRGFVSNVDDGHGQAKRWNQVGSETSAKQRGLQLHARSNMSGDVIYLNSEFAQPLLEQFQETAKHRGWKLLAVAIMANHIHLLVTVDDDPEPYDILGDFKSYGSRKLNRLVGKPKSGTWWTENGSTRKKSTIEAIEASVQYILQQEYPLLLWKAADLASDGCEPVVS
jgi:REP element-mobilizing transposase RayT